MVFSRQPSTQQKKKEFEANLAFYSWSWTTENVAILIFILTLIGCYLKTVLDSIINLFFTLVTEADESKQRQYKILINDLVEDIFNPKDNFNPTKFNTYDSSTLDFINSNIIDMITYFNLI
jgi:hypothetical protein